MQKEIFTFFFYILQDLAARNVLIDTQENCKISDFGMSRELKTDETYSTRVRDNFACLKVVNVNIKPCQVLQNFISCHFGFTLLLFKIQYLLRNFAS